MGKFSDWILFPGTASPKIREGIKNLGFILAAEIEGFVSFTLPQYLTPEQKTRALGNIGAQPLDAALTSISGLTTAANQMIYTTGSDVYATTALTPFARTILDDTTAAAVRTTLGLGTSAIVNTGTSGATIPLLNGANTWSGAQTFSVATTFTLAPTMSAGVTLNSGIAMGSNTAASATDLSKHIALFSTSYGFSVTAASLNFVSGGAHNWYSGTTLIATLSSTGNLNLLGSLNITSGGTGATDAATARTNLGLGNVTNTSDANKPVSTAQQAALDLKANLASPALTGNPTAPTQTQGNNSTRLATTAYVDNGLAGVSNNVVAWVNFNGTGTVAIRASKNVTSITDNGTGDYTVNFTTPFADINYAAVLTGSGAPGASSIAFEYLPTSTTLARTTSSFRLVTFNPGVAQVDAFVVNAVFTR